jgi:diguanylate cyclase (GGDEF)-like protein
MADMTSSGGGLPVAGIPAVPTGDDRGGRQSASSGSGEYEKNVVAEERRRRSMADFRDFVSMLEIPVEELTPAVRKAFERLFAELSEREQKLEELTGRVEWLNSLTDAHPFLPVMNRRAFIGKLSRVLDVVHRSGGSNALIYIEAEGIEQIRREFGHQIEENALIHASDILQSLLSPADIVGNLGGYAFGVVLFNGGQYGIDSFLERLSSQAAASPFKHDHGEVVLDFRSGAVILKGDDSPQSALDAADRVMASGVRQ